MIFGTCSVPRREKLKTHFATQKLLNDLPNYCEKAASSVFGIEAREAFILAQIEPRRTERKKERKSVFETEA